MHFRLAPNPIGNTFGLFCSPRVQPALLGNVSLTFRLPRVLPSIHWRHYSLCHFIKAIRPAHEDFFRTFGMHIRLFSFPDGVGWRF